MVVLLSGSLSAPEPEELCIRQEVVPPVRRPKSLFMYPSMVPPASVKEMPSNPHSWRRMTVTMGLQPDHTPPTRLYEVMMAEAADISLLSNSPSAL